MSKKIKDKEQTKEQEEELTKKPEPEEETQPEPNMTTEENMDQVAKEKQDAEDAAEAEMTAAAKPPEPKKETVDCMHCHKVMGTHDVRENHICPYCGMIGKMVNRKSEGR